MLRLGNSGVALHVWSANVRKKSRATQTTDTSSQNVAHVTLVMTASGKSVSAERKAGLESLALYASHRQFSN